MARGGRLALLGEVADSFDQVYLYSMEVVIGERVEMQRARQAKPIAVAQGTVNDLGAFVSKRNVNKLKNKKHTS